MSSFPLNENLCYELRYCMVIEHTGCAHESSYDTTQTSDYDSACHEASTAWHSISPHLGRQVMRA